ncbi:MAG: NAD(P)/FAD-dependent oxidoreductase [Candidatus Omnitrophica bacterium]|nr:NAD(P)/FAD-dependent oxidoreductase [Candidatus Omnitrophota bacterium]
MPLSKIIIIGAGPAGMGCAYTLAKAARPAAVIEKEKVSGGLCRTLESSGYLFDIGGHRFISSSLEVNRLWGGIMNGRMLKVRRCSRIYYRKKYFNYPLSFANTFFNLGPLESVLCVASYLKNKYLSSPQGDTFEDWISHYFGKRLFKIFFKSYTEKVWGMPCQNISSDWANQRIRGLSLRVAIEKAIIRKSRNSPKTLCEEFLYPLRGPGDFYRRMKEEIDNLGSRFLFGKNASKIRHDGRRMLSMEIRGSPCGEIEEVSVDYLFSSAPLTHLVNSLEPAPPEHILKAAGKLRFRSFITVNIILDKKDVFPDQWIYIHSPSVRLARVQNYKNWSPAMVPDGDKTSLGLEYFCDEADNIWNINDVDMINFAVDELEKVGIVSRRYLINAFVSRHADAYPVYSLGYQESVGVIREYLRQFSNFQTMGRAGLFRYDNSDHALLTGIYAANKFLGKGDYNIWDINSGEGYLET